MTGVSGPRQNYAAVADDYASMLGSIEVTAPEDRSAVERWATTVHGSILDAGCGPGHWTAHLADLGHDVAGLDPVDEFIEIAVRARPDVTYQVGGFVDLLDVPDRYGGILAWYSLIHLDPDDVHDVLQTFHSALAAGGRLLTGFFDGVRLEPFDHAVSLAWRWPANRLQELLEDAGFVVEHVEQRTDSGSRPHAAVSAVVA